MADIIREDIVKVNFDIGSSLQELKKLQNDVNELKKKLTGGMGDEAFDDLKDSVNGSTDSMNKAKKAAGNLNDKLTTLAKKGANLAFNGLKRLASISFKGLIVGLGASAAAIGAVVTKSVQAFADFEQLKGGVETLFGAGGQSIQEYAKSTGKSVSEVKSKYDSLMKAQNTVLENANNAYKTAGLSANDYMETVTSFSASLVSSLGGDTEKAAKYADMAIIDMSDNANKMGTDMSMLQTTYGGFAKQNFTMLDNLKLGYGGTKTEMERLLKDAQKISGVKYDISSFGDIVQAIHVIQDEMGITGTTSKEAEKTITGSLNAMKSSWGNLLTAMASGENLDQCIDNMVDSVETFGKNVIPVAERALLGLGSVIEKLAPIIADRLPDLANKLLPPLIKATVEMTKGLIRAFPNIVKTLFTSVGDILVEQFPALKKFGNFLKNSGEKIAKFTPILLGLVGAFIAFKKIKSIGSVFSGIFGGSKGGSKGGEGKGGLFGGLADLAKMKTTTVLKGMANLAIIFGGFTILAAAFMKVSPFLADMGDTKSIVKMIAIIGALGIVGGVLTKFAQTAGNIPVSTCAKGLANIAIIVSGMSALFLLIGALSLLKFDYGKILALVGVIGVLGLVGGALTILGGIIGLIPVATVALGLVNMAIIVGGMSALFLLIGAVSLLDFNYKKILKLVGIIGVLGTVAAALTVFAGIVGLIPIPVVLAGLANMALVLGGVTAIIVAFGALSKIKGFTEFLTTGGEILTKLFNIIGNMVGSLVGGFGEGVTESLPKIGKNLSAFAKSLKPLFSAFSGVDMSGVGEFFSAIGSFMLKLAGGKILEFFAGSPDFSGIAEGLNTLATNEGVKKFFTMVNGIDSEAFTKGKQFFEVLDGISSLPNSGGFAQLFSGENDFAGVASGLGKLACQGVKNFFAMVSGMDAAAFDNAKALFESLDGISALPNVGGLGQLFAGENDFAGVASGLTKLSGKGVQNFFAMVSKLDSSVFEKTKELFAALAEIGNVGEEGFWERVGKAITGDSDKPSGLTKIANELSDFGDKTTAFFEQVNKLNLSNLNGLWKSLEKAGKLTTENLGKVVDESISTIVDKISKLPQKMGEALKNNSANLSNGFVEMWKAAVKASVAPVNKLLDGANHILKEFGSKKKVIKWTPYANGTDGHKGGNALVNDGRGAELVQMPNGNAFIPSGRNVLIPNAPKGMKVLNADRTAQVMGKNAPTFRYAGGIGDIDVWSFYDNAKGLVDKITQNISYKGMSSFASSVGEGMVSTFAGEMPAWIDKLFEESGQSIASYVASKGVAQWLPTVVRALKMEGQYSVANVARTLFQMRTESGGNPKAINLWDSNAKKGIPSKGLMQVIDPTFKAYARAGFNKNIYDPLSNILASIRYAVSRYGSLSKAYRGKGYANGGIATKPSVFGEDGAEMAIPLSASKRNRAIDLWSTTGEMLGLSYTPENGGDIYTTNSVEYNTYSPSITIHVEGSSDERTLLRKIKRVAKEAIADVIEGVERSNPKLQEV